MVRQWFPALALCACALVRVASAQDPADKSVDGRLLEILKQRGVITEQEFGELKQLERELREESNLEASVEREVSEMVARLADDAPKMSYKKGTGFGFKTADGKFSLNVGGRIQVRATYSAREDVNGNQNDEDLQDLAVQRARLWFKGFAWDPNLKYEIQLEVAGGTARPPNTAGTAFDSADTSLNRLAELRYAFVDWQICDKKPWHNIKAGQFKVPYSRHQMTSSGRQQFVDRALTDPAFSPMFSPGIMYWGTRGGGKEDLFEYYAGIFDGAGAIGIAEGANIQNNDDGLLYAGRAAVNPFGALAYSEADLRPSSEWCKFLMAFGINGYYHQDNNRSATLDNFDDWAVGADVAMAWRGWYAQAEAHWRTDAQPNANDDVESFGWYAQVGYMLIPQRFELGLRYADVNWDGTTAAGTATVPTNSASREYLAVASYYWHEHNMKLQFDFGRVETHFAADDMGPNPNNVDEWRGRLQFQIIF
jgi:phosphate-selective porin OprO and OprP